MPERTRKVPWVGQGGDVDDGDNGCEERELEGLHHKLLVGGVESKL
jgi:hypothetical protein